MSPRVSTAILLALMAAGCNRTAATNNAANEVAPAPQSNVVIAPPMAPPALSNGAKPIAPEPIVEEEAETAAAEGCAGEIGQRAAEQLVLQCRDVSPATRPPCNVANSCALIRSEIARGCGMLGDDAPEYCPVG